MMFCSPRRLVAIAVILGAIALGSCSAQTGFTLPSSQSAPTPKPGAGGATYQYIAGTYAGTWKQIRYYGSESGLITIKVRQYLNYVWGPITLKYSTHRSHLTFTGFLKQRGRHLRFKMRISQRKADDTGHATVDGSTLSGTIVFPARGTAPEIIIAFTTTKR
jgi:hypothetical protein